MTHAHDKTLLTKLGFADPDRKNPLHDLACQYLGDPQIMARVMAYVYQTPPKPPETGTPEFRASHEVRVASDGFTVGFLDVVINYGVPLPFGAEQRFELGRCLVVEVKAGSSSISDAMRQIAVYRSKYFPGNMQNRLEWLPDGYPHAPRWALATCYPIPGREAELLKNADIYHLRLTPERIKAWVQARDEKTHESFEV